MNELATRQDIVTALQAKSLTQITKQTYLDVWKAIQVTSTMVAAEIQGMKTPEISTINRGEGNKEAGISLYEFVVLGLLEFYGCEWSAVQIREAAEILFSEYYWFHIAELKHLIVRIKSGDMGKVFGKFSPAQLMEFFSAYADESFKARKLAFEIQSDNERQSERQATYEQRLKRDSDAYTMSGLILQEKAKLNTDGSKKVQVDDKAQG